MTPRHLRTRLYSSPCHPRTDHPVETVPIACAKRRCVAPSGSCRQEKSHHMMSVQRSRHTSYCGRPVDMLGPNAHKPPCSLKLLFPSTAVDEAVEYGSTICPADHASRCHISQLWCRRQAGMITPVAYGRQTRDEHPSFAVDEEPPANERPVSGWWVTGFFRLYQRVRRSARRASLGLPRSCEADSWR